MWEWPCVSWPGWFVNWYFYQDSLLNYADPNPFKKEYLKPLQFLPQCAWLFAIWLSKSHWPLDIWEQLWHNLHQQFLNSFQESCMQLQLGHWYHDLSSNSLIVEYLSTNSQTSLKYLSNISQASLKNLSNISLKHLSNIFQIPLMAKVGTLPPISWPCQKITKLLGNLFSSQVWVLSAVLQPLPVGCHPPMLHHFQIAGCQSIASHTRTCQVLHAPHEVLTLEAPQLAWGQVFSQEGWMHKPMQLACDSKHPLWGVCFSLKMIPEEVMDMPHVEASFLEGLCILVTLVSHNSFLQSIQVLTDKVETRHSHRKAFKSFMTSDPKQIHLCSHPASFPA